MSTYPSEPYGQVRSWWAEEISSELIKRVGAAPQEHLDEFATHLRDVLRTTKVDAPTGTELLRPLIIRTAIDRNCHSDKFHYISAATPLLLYAHEVLLENPFMWTRASDKAELLKVLSILERLKPLADVGVIRFANMSPNARHPARTHGYVDMLDMDVADPILADEISELIDRAERARTSAGVDFGQLVFSLICDIGMVLNTAAENPGVFNHLVRSNDELAIYKLAMLRAVSVPVGHRDLRLRHLATLSMPKLDSRVDLMLKLRESDEVFADWRSALSVALHEIAALKEGDGTWEQQSREILLDSTDAIRVKSEKIIARSTVLGAMREGTKSFAFSALGAGAGFAAGGMLGPTLTAAAAGKMAEFGIAYLSGLRERRHARAVLDILVAIQ